MTQAPASSPRQAFESAQARVLRQHGVDAQSRFFDVACVDGPVHALVSGTGPPVVLVPGFSDPAAMWAPLMARLGGFTCIAVDRPCFGLTGSADHEAGTLRKLAVGFLEQTLDALRLERPLFVANSIGSLWTLWLALDRPERVRAMVHVGCPATLLGTSAPLLMRLIATPPIGSLLMRVSPPSPQQVENFARLIGEDLSRAPELRDLLVGAQRMPGSQKAIRRLLRAVVRLTGPQPAVTLTARQLGQVVQPNLLLWGARDAFGPPRVGEEAAALLRQAQLVVFDTGGHVPWVTDPDPVAEAALPFLRRHAEERENPA